MHGYGCISSATIVQQFDLGSFRLLADLGGATGHLCLAACEAYPQLSGIVFDLPSAKPFAEEQIMASSVAGRVRFMAGDFFSDPLPTADLFCLGRILHDWDEKKINLLLRRVFEALPSGGALLIAERLVDASHAGPVSALLQDLNMLVCTDGRERTCAEYGVLLDAAGFHSIECRATGTIVDAILAKKP